MKVKCRGTRQVVVFPSGPQFPPMQPFSQGVPDGHGTVLKNDKASCADAQCGLGLWPMLSLGVRVPAVTNDVISAVARTFISLCSWRHLRTYSAPSLSRHGGAATKEGGGERGSEAQRRGAGWTRQQKASTDNTAVNSNGSIQMFGLAL